LPADATSSAPADGDAAATGSPAPAEEHVGGPDSTSARGGPEIETIIGWILRIGVTTSAILIAAGVLLLFFRGSTGYTGALSDLNSLVGYNQATGDRFPTTPGDVFAGLVGLRAYALIGLGLLVLIATPVVRVAASVLLFWLERDTAYVFITLLVLVILIISFLLGKAG
jgi:uncharacterized membrane protein